MDSEYWNKFYAKKEVPTDCSTFAASVIPIIQKDGTLLELGCGNGRDSLYFAANGIQVVATDISETTIKQLLSEKGTRNPLFVYDDFTRLSTPYRDTTYTTIYSRFTLHSVQVEGCSRALEWSYRNLKSGGLLLIEVRSVLDPMCGVGTKVEGERDAYINTHYRRFLRKQELVDELTKIGFKIEFLQEENNLAIWKDDNPVVIRVHAKKL